MNFLKIKGKIIIPAFIAFIIFILIAFYLAIPVNISGIYYGQQSPSILCNDSEIPTISLPARNTYRVVVTKISDETDQVELCLPIPENGIRLKTSDLVERSEGWSEAAGDTRLTTSKKGAHLVFDIDAASPELTFIKMPSGGMVEISMGEWKEIVDTKNNDTNEHAFYTIKLKPSKFKLIGNLGSLFSVKKINILSPKGDCDLLSQVTISLGVGQSLNEYFYKNNLNIWILSYFSKIKIILKCIQNIGIAYLSVGVIIILSYMFGAVILSERNAIIVSNPLLIFCSGLCALYLLINSLTYVFSANQLSFVFSIFLLIIVMLGVYRISKDKNALQEICKYKFPFFLSVSASLLVFWPIGTSGALFLGLFKTDTFYYTNAATLLQANSLLNYINNGSLVGYGMRSIDVTFISLFSLLFNQSPAALWVSVCILFCVIPPLFAYGYSLEHTNQKNVAYFAAFAVALSAPITALFFEGYFSQFLLTGALYMNLYSGIVLLISLTERDKPFVCFIPFLLTSCFIVLLYPYFSIITIALTFLIALKIIFVGKIRCLFYNAISGLLFTNIGLLFLANPSSAENFVNSLNSIARWVVFPFYNQPKFIGFLLGLVPFHYDNEKILQIVTELNIDQNILINGIRFYLNTANGFSVYFVALLMAGCLIYAFYSNIRSKRLNITIAVLWILYFVFSTFLIFYVIKFSGLYAFCKLTWTIVCFLPLFFSEQAALFITAKRQENKIKSDSFVRFVLIPLGVFFCLTNLTSTLIPSMLWFSNPSGAIYRLGYVHVAHSLQHRIENLAKMNSEKNNSLSVSFPNISNLSQTDLIYFAHFYSESMHLKIDVLNPNIVIKSLDVRGASYNTDIDTSKPIEINSGL